MTNHPAHSLGQLLTQARNDSGKSLRELHEDTLILPKYLSALEQDNFEELPGAAYVKGYLRRIAEVLNTPAEPLLTAYDARNQRAATAAPIVTAAPVAPPAAATTTVRTETDNCQATSDRSYLMDLIKLTQHLIGYLWSDILPWLRNRLPGKRILLLLLLLLIAFFVYRQWPASSTVEVDTVTSTPLTVVTEPEPITESVIEPVIVVEEAELTPEPEPEVTLAETLPEPAIEPIAAAPAPEPEPEPEPVSAGPDMIAMDFYGPSVVNVTDADGNLIASGLKRAGESVRARGRQPFKIQVGNPGATDIRVNGIVVQGTPL